MLSCIGLTSGARQLVVQDAFEITASSFERVSWLTPYTIVASMSVPAGAEIKSIDEVGEEDLILDIGPETTESYCNIINETKTTIWNGPLGVFEFSSFAEGTRALGHAVSSNQGFTIVGGGDTVAVVEELGIADSMSYISTGGGAFLDFVQNGTLPILDLLEKKRGDS